MFVCKLSWISAILKKKSWLIDLNYYGLAGPALFCAAMLKVLVNDFNEVRTSELKEPVRTFLPSRSTTKVNTAVEEEVEKEKEETRKKRGKGGRRGRIPNLLHMLHNNTQWSQNKMTSFTIFMAFCLFFYTIYNHLILFFSVQGRKNAYVQ